MNPTPQIKVPKSLRFPEVDRRELFTISEARIKLHGAQREFLRRLKTKITLSLSALAFAYITACGYLWSTQTQAIFDPCKEILTDPGRMGMDYDPVAIPVTSDGKQITLDGIWIPAKTGEAINKVPSILHLHGQDDTIGKNLEHNVRQLNALGYNVLQVDYRGYGESFDTYKPSEKTVYEDTEAAWQFLINDLGADPNRTFIYGHSLGGAIAIELAIDHPDGAAGLIVESTFTSIADMSKERYAGAPALLPIDLLIRHPFNSNDKIGNLRMPVLLIHGDGDEKIPSKMSEELFDLAPEPKQLLLIEGREHANSASIGSVEYKATVSEFVERYIRSTATE